MGILIVFLAVTWRASTSRWMLMMFLASVAIIGCMSMVFWHTAMEYGELSEGGPMVVAMLFGILPVLHLGHKLLIWGLLGVSIIVVNRVGDSQSGLTVFYFVTTVMILIIYQWQMDRLMRIQFQTELLEREKAETDQLTGTLNRHSFEKKMAAAMEHMAPGEHLALMMIDIDYFKGYNDHYGHIQGDKALVRVARILSSLPAEMLLRFGGEEFILMARYQESRPAWLDQVPEVISHQKWPHEQSPLKYLTVSAGLTVYQKTSQPAPTVKALLTRADDAVYKAKASGRNQQCEAACDVEPG
jgi:diguanylate cyclase (GGDEF)-like protein